MGVSTILRTRFPWISKTVARLRGQHLKRQNAQQPKASNIPNEQHMQRLNVTDLPNEIILEVFDFLSQISQGCFALSCRRLYHRFKYIFSASMFRFPCYDGIDPEVNIRARNQFLSRLQVTKGNHEHRWVYCYICLKLHPWNEFDSLALKRRKFPYCKWPGLVALCPCLRFSPIKLIQLCHGLSPTRFDTDDIKRIIWHQCYFTSPCGRLSYELNIALSRQGSRITFHFTYLINDKKYASPYQGDRKIMLCPHENALANISESNIPKVFEELCCARSRTISYSRDRGYKITFERTCNIPL